MVKCSCGASMIDAISDINVFIDVYQKENITKEKVGILKNVPILTCSKCDLDILAVEFTLISNEIHLKSIGE